MLAETGVQVRCICPSFADTNIIREGIENVAETREKIVTDWGLMKYQFCIRVLFFKSSFSGPSMSLKGSTA